MPCSKTLDKALWLACGLDGLAKEGCVAKQVQLADVGPTSPRGWSDDSVIPGLRRAAKVQDGWVGECIVEGLDDLKRLNLAISAAPVVVAWENLCVNAQDLATKECVRPGGMAYVVLDNSSKVFALQGQNPCPETLAVAEIKFKPGTRLTVPQLVFLANHFDSLHKNVAPQSCSEILMLASCSLKETLATAALTRKRMPALTQNELVTEYRGPSYFPEWAEKHWINLVLIGSGMEGDDEMKPELAPFIRNHLLLPQTSLVPHLLAPFLI